MKKPRPETRTRGLVVVATPIEAQAIGAPNEIVAWRSTRLNDQCDIVIAGIGKANAAAATVHAATPDTPFVLSTGLCGALPGSGLAITDTILATRSIYADEGLLTPDGFQTCAEMGFPIGQDGTDIALPDAQLMDRLSPLADHAGPIATVSTCSGTDTGAAHVVRRTRALAEAMEGAAVLHAAHRLGLPAAELRVVSNTTGDRAAQQWDIRAALARLGEVIGSI